MKTVEPCTGDSADYSLIFVMERTQDLVSQQMRKYSSRLLLSTQYFSIYRERETKYSAISLPIYKEKAQHVRAKKKHLILHIIYFL